MGNETEMPGENGRKPIPIPVRVIGFILAFVVLFFTVQSILTPKFFLPGAFPRAESMKELGELEDHTVQVLFLGTSHVYMGISPMQLYRDYGITSFSLSGEGMPIGCSYFVLKEALKTQHPEVVFLDVSKLFGSIYQSATTTTEWEKVLYTTPLTSDLRPGLVEAFVSRSDNDGKDAKQIREERLGAWLPIYKVHDRWEELKYSDFLSHKESQYRGYKGQVVEARITPSKTSADTMNWVADLMSREDWISTTEYIDGEGEETITPWSTIYSVDTDEQSLEWLLEIKKLCEENGIRFVTTKIPAINNPVSYESSWTIRKNEAVKALAQKYDFEYLDMQYGADLGIDWSTDTMDGGKHLNILGAEKVTEYLGDYLTEVCKCEGRIDARYEQDLIDFEEAMRVAHLQTTQDFGTYMEKLKNSPRNLTVFMAVCEDISVGITPEEIQALKSIGLQTDFEAMEFSDTFVAVWNHQENGENSIPYETVSNRFIEYTYPMENEKTVKMMSKGGLEYAYVSIVIDNESYAPALRGLWLVVYDNDAEMVIDHAGFDFGGSDHAATHPWSDQYLRDYECYVLGLTA